MEQDTQGTGEQELAAIIARAPEANATVDAYEPIEKQYFAATAALNPGNLYVTSTQTVYQP